MQCSKTFHCICNRTELWQYLTCRDYDASYIQAAYQEDYAHLYIATNNPYFYIRKSQLYFPDQENYPLYDAPLFIEGLTITLNHRSEMEICSTMQQTINIPVEQFQIIYSVLYQLSCKECHQMDTTLRTLPFLDVNLCEQCRNKKIKFQMLCSSQVCSQYNMTFQELQKVCEEFVLASNPVKGSRMTWPVMKLFFLICIKDSLQNLYMLREQKVQKMLKRFGVALHSKEFKEIIGDKEVQAFIYRGKYQGSVQKLASAMVQLNVLHAQKDREVPRAQKKRKI